MNKCQLDGFPKHLVEEAMGELVKQRIKKVLDSEDMIDTIDAMLEKELIEYAKKHGPKLVQTAFEKEKKNMVNSCIDEMIDNGFSDKIREEMDEIAEEAVLEKFKLLNKKGK